MTRNREAATYRLQPRTLELIEELAARLGCARVAVVERAVEALSRQVEATHMTADEARAILAGEGWDARVIAAVVTLARGAGTPG